MSEPERLLRMLCADFCGHETGDRSLEFFRQRQSSEIGDIALAIQSSVVKRDVENAVAKRQLEQTKAALRKLVDAAHRSLPIIEQDAWMVADLMRSAPLPPEAQAQHDTTEYESERLLRELPAAIAEAERLLNESEENQ